MSKELEALENIFSHWNCCNPNSNGCDKKDFEIIESALKRLETLEEEKQSFDRQLEKKLKALEIMKEILTINEDDFYEENGKYYFIGNEVDKDTFGLLKEVLL